MKQPLGQRLLSYRCCSAVFPHTSWNRYSRDYEVVRTGVMSSPWEAGQAADQRRSLTGYNIRDRARRALASGADVLSTAMASDQSQDENASRAEPRRRLPRLSTATNPSSLDVGSSSSSSPISASSRMSVSSANLARALKNRSTSLSSLSEYLGSTNLSSETSGSSTASSVRSSDSNSTRGAQEKGPGGERTYKRRIVPQRRSTATLLHDIRAKTRSYTTAHLGPAGRMHEHNLYPLPPPGHIRPVLLPTYAVKEKEAISIRIDGFVEVWPTSTGTTQRVFNQMVRQVSCCPEVSSLMYSLPQSHVILASARWSSQATSSTADASEAGQSPAMDTCDSFVPERPCLAPECQYRRRHLLSRRAQRH